jgi:hypothetical protein
LKLVMRKAKLIRISHLFQRGEECKMLPVVITNIETTLEMER